MIDFLRELLSNFLDPLKLALAIAWSSTYALYFWGARYYFRRPKRGKLPARLKILFLLAVVSFFLFMFYYFFGVWTPDRILIAIGSSVIAFSLYTWALWTNKKYPFPVAFSKLDSHVLVTHGPYKWIRNPIYTSYMIFWVAGAFAINQWPAYLLGALHVYFYIDAVRGEEKALTAQFGDAYLEYKKRAGRFFPKF